MYLAGMQRFRAFRISNEIKFDHGRVLTPAVHCSQTIASGCVAR
jgi:hypothetical protein